MRTRVSGKCYCFRLDPINSDFYLMRSWRYSCLNSIGSLFTCSSRYTSSPIRVLQEWKSEIISCSTGETGAGTLSLWGTGWVADWISRYWGIAIALQIFYGENINGYCDILLLAMLLIATANGKLELRLQFFLFVYVINTWPTRYIRCQFLDLAS